MKENKLDEARAAQLSRGLKDIFEQTLQDRVRRYLEIGHQGIIAGHYYARVSSECIDLYRDGYFISAVMLSHAINEGIFKMVAERNSVSGNIEHKEVLAILVGSKLITQDCSDASSRIWGSFRNDVHHMNPKVGEINFQELAKRNLQDLAVIEKEIFAFQFVNGALRPIQPLYWDINPDGTVPVFVRLS